MKNTSLIITAFLMTATPALSSDLVHEFKNPSFSGQGWSQHVLSLEQLEFNRRQDIQDEIEAEQARIERELENSTLSKFIRNIESRIYATLSKQMVDNMFAACEDPTGAACPTSGTTEIEGSEISWSKDVVTGEITLEVVESDGSRTTISIPGAGEFSF
mgnify:CR=1 FL=1